MDYDCPNMKDRKVKAFLVKEEGSDNDMVNLDKETFKVYCRVCTEYEMLENEAKDLLSC